MKAIKVLATAAVLFVGMLAGTSFADPDDKPLKDAEKAERKAVAVPEPSAVLLSALGIGGVLASAWYARRRGSA
jgi:PEP-CTERM motif